MTNSVYLSVCLSVVYVLRYRMQEVEDSIDDILLRFHFLLKSLMCTVKTLEKLFEKEDYTRRDEI